MGADGNKRREAMAYDPADEIESIAERFARQGNTHPRVGDALPVGTSAAACEAIALDVEGFGERVRAYAYAHAMTRPAARR